MGLKLHQVKALWDSSLKIKISSKSLYVAFLCFAIFAQKFKNSKWPPFLAKQIFFENGITTLQRYPVGQKFVEIALSSTVFEI